MDSRSDLSGLLGRVEEATGANFELERALFEALGMPTEWFGSRVIGHFRVGGGYGFNTEDGSRHLDAVKTPAYTASLDAALGLCERVLPGWQWSIVGPDMEMRPFVRLFSHNFRGEEAETEGATPALAVIAAMLRALIAQGEAGTAEPGRP